MDDPVTVESLWEEWEKADEGSDFLSLSIDVTKAADDIRKALETLFSGLDLGDENMAGEVSLITERAEGIGLYTLEEDSAMGAVPGYESLELILTMAYQHAACSKGKERHASGLPFHEQPMQRESDDLGTAAGLIYQARKKIREGSKLPTERAQIAEMVGAINYIAGWIIWTLRQGADEELNLELREGLPRITEEQLRSKHDEVQ